MIKIINECNNFSYPLFYTEKNPLHKKFAIDDTYRRTWVIWDIINIAWLINPDWVPTFVTTSPVFNDELLWEKSDHRHLMREAFDVRRDEIFIDFYEKLNKL